MPTVEFGGTNAETGAVVSDATGESTAAQAPGKTEAMAAVMIDTFGARALAIVQAEVDAATPEQPSVAETWQRIAEAIRDRIAAADDPSQ